MEIHIRESSDFERLEILVNNAIERLETDGHLISDIKFSTAAKSIRRPDEDSSIHYSAMIITEKKKVQQSHL